MIRNKIASFERQVDCWVLRSVDSGITTFKDLLVSLPGVYPSIVMKSIQRLSHFGLLPISLSEKLTLHIMHKKESVNPLNKINKNNIPHPLDYDWRFTNSTSQYLLDFSYKLSKPYDKIVMLGTPSLLETASNAFTKRRLILLDKNAKTRSNTKKKLRSYKCNLVRDNLPDVEAQVVIADPPWYTEYMCAFVWAASKMSKIGGYLLLCLPPEGTRSTVLKELQEIFDFVKNLGFVLLEYKKGVLSYETPLFENNALKEEGLKTIPADWRRGDYALFSHISQKNIARPLIHEEEWIEIKVKNTKIRIRLPTLGGFQDPSLLPLVHNDILPSVSRSDNRRKIANVWTSGNRIFACKGVNILIPILVALSFDLSPIATVSIVLNRKLHREERKLVLSTVRQIDKIVECEQKELEQLP